jgi:hypothetical protein
MRKARPLEKEIQLSVCDYLAFRKHFFWRQNTSPMYDTARQTFRSMPKYALRGVPDIILVKNGGLVVFLEIKRPGGVQSEWQRAFEQQATAKGAVYKIITSLDEVIAMGL